MYSSNHTKEKRARDAGLRDGVTVLIASSDNRDLTIKTPKRTTNRKQITHAENSRLPKTPSPFPKKTARTHVLTGGFKEKLVWPTQGIWGRLLKARQDTAAWAHPWRAVDGMSARQNTTKSGRQNKERKPPSSQLDFYWPASISDKSKLNGAVERPQRQAGMYAELKSEWWGQRGSRASPDGLAKILWKFNESCCCCCAD